MTAPPPLTTVGFMLGVERVNGLVRAGYSGGGAKGIRTPDLLIANETRYQLRHSPMSAFDS